MSYEFQTRLGKQLYRLLPELYRTRDRASDTESDSGYHLAKYLDAHGELLDRILATLEQQLLDGVPGTSQDWLLPYFAKLLSVNIVSPDKRGRAAEVANAVDFRQRKGTLAAADQIAQTVGEMEVTCQEGWKRVARTPRVGIPLQPAEAMDNTLSLDMTLPSEATRHPGLPVSTVDMRRTSRAVKTASSNPAAEVSTFGETQCAWRHAHPHGTPCGPGGFDDVSARTVDIRTPAGDKGRYHHKRLLVHAPPPDGFFSPQNHRLTWAELTAPTPPDGVTIDRTSETLRVVNRSGGMIEVTDDVVLTGRSAFMLKGLCFNGSLTVSGNRTLTLARCAVNDLTMEAALSFDDDGEMAPALDATDTLIDTLSVMNGLARLEYCTITTAACRHLQASDTIFSETLAGTAAASPESACIRYCRLPAGFSAGAGVIAEETNTNAPAYFFQSIDCTKRGRHLRATVYGEPGYGVLAPSTPKAVRFGAEDGGEMGAFHHLYNCLKAAAMVDKLREFLPVGIEPVLIFDVGLRHTPPDVTT